MFSRSLIILEVETVVICGTLRKRKIDSYTKFTIKLGDRGFV